MNELKPVSFRKPVEPAPRLSPVYVKGRRSDRFWSEEEFKVLRDHFEQHGGAFCHERLPGRSLGSVYQAAYQLGLKRQAMATPRFKAPAGAELDALDAEIREGWAGDTKKGFTVALAARLGVPKHWLCKRALKLGLTKIQLKEPNWSPAELELLRRVPLHLPDKASRIFKEHGYARTPTSIVIKAKRENLSRRYTETLSAAAVARILGADGKTVGRWIELGWLRAVKRENRRLPQQGGWPWSIERPELRRFIIEEVGRLDFRKVDKLALVDLLVTTQPPREALAEAPRAAPPHKRNRRCWTCRTCRTCRRRRRRA